MGSKTTKTNQTTNETATTTPNVPDYINGPVQNYYSQIGSYANADPYSYATPANGLQQQAAGSAGNLSSNPLFGTAANAMQGLLGAATPTAGYQSASMAQLPSVTNASAQGYNPTAATANLATAANAGNAAQVNLQGYNAGTLGPANSYQAQGYTAAQAGPVNLSQNVADMQAQSLLSNFNSYLNPTTGALVDATLANFDDQAGRQQAAMSAQAAKAGAFGGSRYGIAEAQLLSDQGRNRSLTEAELRNNAWNSAAGLSATDTGFRQQAASQNAQARNNRAETLAALQAQNNQFNAGAKNDASAFSAGANNQAGQFNANAQNQYGLAQFDANNTASQFNANAANQGSLFNAGAQNEFGLANAGFQQQANLANAAALNDTSQFNAGASNQAAQFGAGAQNTANLANAQAQNQFGLAGFDAGNQMNQFNASQANQNSQFNAQQQLASQAQQLAAAQGLSGIAGDMSQQDLANIAAQLQAGNTMWDIQNQYNQAPLTQLQNYAGLLNPALIDQMSGQTITSNGTMTGTQKQSGGLLGTLGGILSLASALPTGGLTLLGGAGSAMGAASGMFSDSRLKTNIKQVGTLSDGLGVYSYDYIWGEPAVGVMADEVEQLRPWALGAPVNGFATVNYEAL